LALRQPELEKQSREEMSVHWDQKQREEKRSQPDIRPLAPHERADATVIPREAFENKIRAKVEKMLQVKSK
jgi:hypothetical protein